MEDLLSVDRLLAVWNIVYEWLRTNVFVLDNAVQVGVIVLRNALGGRVRPPALASFAL